MTDAITKETLNRVCPGPTELDDFGDEFELCPEGDNGHLYFQGWCLHCHCEEPE